MMMISDVLKTFVNELAIDNLPVNILVGEYLYDIEDFYFDKNIHEYIMILKGGYKYEKRGGLNALFS